jgi:hypothetical protein
MAFSDPQSVTVNSVAQSLARVSTGENASSYRKDDGSYRMTVRHSYGKRNRSNIRLDFVKVAADPFTPSINKEINVNVGLTIDRPAAGFTNTEIKYVVDALTAYLAASSGAKVTQLLGGES